MCPLAGGTGDTGPARCLEALTLHQLMDLEDSLLQLPEGQSA